MQLGATIMPSIVFDDFKKWFIDWKLEWFEDLPEISHKKRLFACCGQLTKFCGFIFEYQKGVYDKYLEERNYVISREINMFRVGKWILYWIFYPSPREQGKFETELEAYKKAFECVEQDLKLK